MHLKVCVSPLDRPMIFLTRLNHVPLVVNSDLIEHIEVTPDTVIALTTGQKILVRETAEEIVERVVEFRRRICDRPQPLLETGATSEHYGSDPA